MRRAAGIAALALFVVLPGGAMAARAAEITPATVEAVERWVAAVNNHRPGFRDADVEMVAAMTFDKRRELDQGMDFFLSFLRGKPITIRTPAQRLLASIAGAARQIPGPDAFLKRAAVLHADAAFKRQADAKDPGEPVGRIPRGAGSSPLLSQNSLWINRDGEILGSTPAEWNWPFARSLLDLLAVRPEDHPFVATWYHATAAFMLAQGLYGEAVSHLRRAAEVLPDNALILFDRACYAEILGLPRNQVLLSANTAASRVGRLDLPSEMDTNIAAEKLFRRAFSVDPSFVEARVRLGRLLGRRKRHGEAASELAAALAANPTGPVLFYAHLFAGRSAQALGRIADAAGHYEAADRVFPGAQSSGLARSQAALLEADAPAALESVQRIDTSRSARDPWRWYQLGAGRDAGTLLREMWNQVLKF